MSLSKQKTSPIIALIISTLGVASAIILVKLSEVDATATLMLRMFFAGGIAFALSKYERPEQKSDAISKRWVFMLLLLSGVLSCIDLLSNHWAVRLTSVANTTILMNLSPLFVVLLSWVVWKEKLTFGQVFALFLAIAGASLLIIEEPANLNYSKWAWLGNLLALNSALFYALYFVVIKYLRSHYTANQIIIWNSFTCAVLLVPFSVYTSPQIFPSTWEGYLIILSLAVISQLLGHGLMAYALKYVSVDLASISTMARPVVAILFGWAIFGEKLTIIQWVGVFSVVVGIYCYKILSSNIQISIKKRL